LEIAVFVVFGAYVNAEAFASLACAGSPPVASTLLGKEIPLNATLLSLICLPCQYLSLQVICNKPGRIIVNDIDFLLICH
jgi:hypothetical protein